MHRSFSGCVPSTVTTKRNNFHFVTFSTIAQLSQVAFELYSQFDKSKNLWHTKQFFLLPNKKASTYYNLKIKYFILLFFRGHGNESCNLIGSLPSQYFPISAQRPENTKKETLYDINVWKRFLTSAGEERNIEDIPVKDLNVLMSRFSMDIKKKDGDQYEPAILISFQRSLQRYLNDHGSTLNILKDQQLSLPREALTSRGRQLLRDFG